ncbi:hypothetical protein CTAYLR_005117 [Chrysophaeum taylorii]|uniref:NADH dehydrogenase [ubiquinone] 1 alpha subcomplex subunit 13 n=1 Tax=Chrysophaeum taylorii TaxID=2483200 RepID=A0AAD7UER9_9STRA|nr:hypothetical protein CTAYLR_005117 [Chrysophaeum taylorii]
MMAGRVSMMLRVSQRRLASGKATTHIPYNELRAPVQDMPPPGGYPEVIATRGIGPRGPPGWAIWLGATFATVFGLYRVGEGNRERNAAKKMKREARMAIIPYLQAEEDVRAHALYLARLDDEARVMKGVKGWKVGESVYHNTSIWMPATPTNNPKY